MNRRLRELDFLSGVAVTVDGHDVQLAVDRAAKLIPDQIMEAAGAAQRKAMVELRKTLMQDLKDDTTLDPRVITKAVRTKTPRRRNAEVEGHVRVASSRLPLIRYARGISPLRITAEKGKRPQDWKALSYRLDGSGKTFDNSPRSEGDSRLFVAQLRSGHMGVFSRLAGSSLINEETGPSVQFHVAADEKRAKYEGLLITRFEDALAREVSARGGGE